MVFVSKIVFLLVVLGLHQCCGHVPPAAHEDSGSSPAKTRVRRLSGVPKPVWHVGIYQKISKPYTNICGGTVVRNDIVISAAHCFSANGKPPQASDYAVGGNKIYRRWDDPNDPEAQQLDVKEVILPPQYHGDQTNYQSDIALLRLATPFRYTRGLRPVCVDFDEDFEGQQLRDGNRGTGLYLKSLMKTDCHQIAGWGLTDANGAPSRQLLWLEPQYVSPARCVASFDKTFIPYMTWDKICAGDNSTGKAACKGDSGGALVFWRGRTAKAVPYFRGIVSTAPRSEDLCNLFTVVAYTRLSAHKTFLLDNIPGIDQDCQFKDTKHQL